MQRINSCYSFSLRGTPSTRHTALRGSNTLATPAPTTTSARLSTRKPQNLSLPELLSRLHHSTSEDHSFAYFSALRIFINLRLPFASLIDV